jgi:hypothetical protein
MQKRHALIKPVCTRVTVGKTLEGNVRIVERSSYLLAYQVE